MIYHLKVSIIKDVLLNRYKTSLVLNLKVSIKKVNVIKSSIISIISITIYLSL